MYPPLRPEEQVTEGRRRRDTGTHPIIITARNKLERWRAEQFAHCTSGIVCCSQKDTSHQAVAPTQPPVCSNFALIALLERKFLHWIGGEIGATTVGPATQQQQTSKENTCALLSNLLGRDRCEIQREHLLSRVGAAWWNADGAFAQPSWCWLVGLDVSPPLSNKPASVEISHPPHLRPSHTTPSHKTQAVQCRVTSNIQTCAPNTVLIQISDIFLISLIIHLPTMIFVQIAESALMCRRQELKTQWLESKLVNIWIVPLSSTSQKLMNTFNWSQDHY